MPTALWLLALTINRPLHAATVPPQPAPQAAQDPAASTDPASWFAEARAAGHLGQREVARALYGRLVALQAPPPWEFLARYNRALLWEADSQFAEAVEDYQAIIAKASLGDAEHVWLDATQRLAVCLTKLQRYPEAQAAFDVLLGQALEPDERLEARVGQGIVAELAGQDDVAEMAFSDALRAVDALRIKGAFDDRGLGAEAAFRLGDVAERRFAAVQLEFPQAQLAARLEQKCAFLLAAQTRYLRAMRYGDAQTVALSGLRIGQLYEDLHGALVALSVPPDMTPEEAEIYQDEVRKRVGVLVKKAAMVYEKALHAGKRINTADIWLARLENALARLKTVYATEIVSSGRFKDQPGLTSTAETVQ